jgi:primosomal protein N' (replication factor Y)
VSFDLLRWAADYYHHPLGSVIAAALPAALRTGQSALVSRTATDPAPYELRVSNVTPTPQQARAVDAITGSLGTYAAHLLDGVTGSGKTEVYLRVIAAALSRGGQALVLVPEIALTPQLVARFRRRFSGGIAVLHSSLPGTARRDAWRSAHSGEARIVIGTRSAVFTSLPRLALIVVDEEHDASYKQQDGFRYSARDLAVWRAQRAHVPIVLGSATPSLETLDNVAHARYSHVLLPERPGAAQPPRLALVDLRKHASEQGLSQPAMHAIGRHLAAGGQIIVYLNRRGYAPALFCCGCGWMASCAHCDARMTLHRRAARLRCHHCGASAPVPSTCASCGQPLNPVGQGTERVEETLARLFPDAPLARLDRDTAAGRGALEAVLQRVQSGEARILIGTQMLTKGHHFPDVSLVVILDADQGLFASDFRATERLAQTITQVAGRAGRAARPGEVLIQTQFPEHPLLNRLITEGYGGFAAGALEERRKAQWPPYSRLAMLRAEAKDTAGLDAFLRSAAAGGLALREDSVKILGPAQALIARRADYFRAHLLIEATARSSLQRFLSHWLPQVDTLPGAAGIRWSIDVDPLEVD